MDKADLLHVLDTTCGYYTIHNRGIAQDTKNVCVFFDLATGHKCAVGRLLTDEEAAYLQALDSTSTITKIMKYLDTYDNNLAKSIWSKLSKYPVRYLQDIQRLHDEYAYWDDNGLTDDGRNYADYIRNSITTGDYNE
jgi:hypothetical protein